MNLKQFSDEMLAKHINGNETDQHNVMEVTQKSICFETILYMVTSKVYSPSNTRGAMLKSTLIVILIE